MPDLLHQLLIAERALRRAARTRRVESAARNRQQVLDLAKEKLIQQ